MVSKTIVEGSTPSGRECTNRGATRIAPPDEQTRYSAVSAGNDNPDRSNESLDASDETAVVAGAEEVNVESPTRANPNTVADPPETTGGGVVPPGSRGGGGGGGGGQPGGPGGKKPSEADSTELFTNWSEFIQFLKDTWAEFRKISWPTRQQVLQETWSVIVLVSLLTGLVLAFDWGVAKFVFEPLDKVAKKMGGGVGNTTQSWGPLTPQPGAPTDQPGVPGNQPETQKSSPDGKLNSDSVTVPVPTSGPGTPSGQKDSSPSPSPTKEER